MNNFINSIKNNNLFSSFVVYIGSTLINAAVPFIMLPVFTHYLTPADYGIVSMFTVLGSFIMPFVGFSTVGVISREYFNRNETDFGLYVGNIFILLIISLILISVFILIFSDKISKLSMVPNIVIWLSLFFSFFSFFLNVILIIWQAQSKPKSYGLFQISQTVLNVILSLLLVVLLNLGWKGRIASQVFVAFLFGVGSIFFINKTVDLKIRYNKSYITDAFKIGLPLIPHTLGAIFISLSDRMFISNMVGIEIMGLYSLAYSIGNIIGFVEQSFNQAFAPWLFEKLNLNDLEIKKMIVKYTYVYFILILILVFLLNLFIPFLFKFLIDKKFEGAQEYILWISLSFAFSGMYKMVTNYIFYVKKTHILAKITFFSAIINLILNYFLIREYGAIGAGITAAIVSFFYFIFTWFLSYKLYKMPWFELNNFYKAN
jgi:O-antigen/teichoic acid export membrane protein